MKSNNTNIDHFLRPILFILGFIALFSSQAKAQILDIVSLDYTQIPKGSSNIRYSRERASFNIPIKLKNDDYVFLGLDYSSIDLEFSEEMPEFDKTEIEAFQILNFNFGYTFKMNEDWRFGANVLTGFTSNLSRDELVNDDLSFATTIAFIKDKKDDETLAKPYRLILGVNYSKYGGIPFPIPFISYYVRFHQFWSYNLGVPSSNLQYHFSEALRFKLFAQLDGFNSNIQRPLTVNGTDNADQLSMALILAGLRTEYNFGKHVEAFLIGNYILSNNVQLKSGRDKLLTLNNDNVFYFRFGVRLKP